MSAKRRQPNDGRTDQPRPGDDAERLIRAFAQGLPEALDDEVAARLAARMRPFLAGPAVEGAAAAERLLTVAEAASRAHVHIETIRRAVREGRLTIAGRVGRSLRIQPAEVDRWIAAASGVGGTIRTPAARRVRRAQQTSDFSLKAAFKQAG